MQNILIGINRLENLPDSGYFLRKFLRWEIYKGRLDDWRNEWKFVIFLVEAISDITIAAVYHRRARCWFREITRMPCSRIPLRKAPPEAAEKKRTRLTWNIRATQIIFVALCGWRRGISRVDERTRMSFRYLASLRFITLKFISETLKLDSVWDVKQAPGRWEILFLWTARTTGDVSRTRELSSYEKRNVKGGWRVLKQCLLWLDGKKCFKEEVTAGKFDEIHMENSQRQTKTSLQIYSKTYFSKTWKRI